MYNRYIPQADGSYRKNRCPESAQVCDMPQIPAKDEPEASRQHRQTNDHSSAGDFLQRLLPKHIDTGDLMIILLLLLMSAEHKEEKNTALLTLALYFFI